MLEALRSFLSGKTLLIFVTIMAIPFVFLGSSAVGTIFTTYGKVNGLEVTQADLNAANNTVNQRLVDVYGDAFTLDMIPEDNLLEMLYGGVEKERDGTFGDSDFSAPGYDYNDDSRYEPDYSNPHTGGSMETIDSDGVRETDDIKQDYGELIGKLAAVAGIDDPLLEMTES